MGYGRAVLWGAVAAVVVVALAAAGILVLKSGGRSAIAPPGDRIMVVIAARAADGGQVAQLIGVVDMARRPEQVQLVDPLATATVPGTSYNKLRDAYAFGGGAGVVQAFARLGNAATMPFVAVTQDGLVAAVDRSGGVTVDVPADTNVFDGTKLFTFNAGPHKLDGAHVAALLSSVDFVKSSVDQSLLRARIAAGLLRTLAASPPDMSDLLASGAISSSLAKNDLALLVGNIRQGLDRAVVTTSAP